MMLDHEVLRQLHTQYAPAMQAYALRLCGSDPGRAQDAVQEAFVRAWKHPEVLDASRGSTRSWLITTVRNILIDEYRARQVRPQVVADLEADYALDNDEIGQLLSAALIQDALRSLSASHREAILHCYYGGLTVSEVAHQLDLPAGTVKSRLFYGLRALKAALEERGFST